MTRLKTIANTDAPRSVFYNSIAEAGSITGIRNGASHLRNIQQVKNMKKTLNEQPTDSTLELITMLEQGDPEPDKAFVRKFEAAADPYVVLATNQQLKDIERFAPIQVASESLE